MKEFNAFSKKLEKIMLNEYDIFNLQKSPIAKIVHTADYEQLVYIIGQYTILPKELVNYMELMREKAIEMGWHKIAEELEENIAEECGKGNEGLSHYLMLVTELEQGLSINLQDTQPSLATAQMLDCLKKLFNHEPFYVLGTMYAVEKVSISEITLTKKIVSHLFNDKLPNQVQCFFDMHLGVWEIEHEEDLRSSISKYLMPSDYAVFEAGFRVIMDMCELWWKNLMLEAIINRTVSTKNSLLHLPLSGHQHEK